MRKELEACGIECYPQKEFDEDMEDKSDNDKIRVRGTLHILHAALFFPLIFHPSSVGLCVFTICLSN